MKTMEFLEKYQLVETANRWLERLELLLQVVRVVSNKTKIKSLFFFYDYNDLQSLFFPEHTTSKGGLNMSYDQWIASA